MNVRGWTVLACLCGLLGTALLLDCVSAVRADPVTEGDYTGETCPYQSTEYSSTAPCNPVTTNCGLFDNSNTCSTQIGGYVNQIDFPTECTGGEYATACDYRFRDCAKPQKCMLNPMSKCILGPAEADYEKAAKLVNLRCVPPD
ncbi:MAG: hypothetical protein U0746_13210 [Gemmataceae bacterium]